MAGDRRNSSQVMVVPVPSPSWSIGSSIVFFHSIKKMMDHKKYQVREVNHR